MIRAARLQIFDPRAKAASRPASGTEKAEYDNSSASPIKEKIPPNNDTKVNSPDFIDLTL
jgi:hypothetical protein